MNPWIEPLSDWLLRTSLEGAALILIVMLLIKALGRNLGPRWRVLLWMVVGLKLLLPASLPLVPGFGNWGRDPVVSRTLAPLVEGAIGEVPAMDAPLAAVVAESSARPAVEDPAGEAPGLSTWLLLLWGGGLLAFLVASLLNQRRFMRNAGLKPCRDPELLALVRHAARELGLSRDFRVALAPAGTTPAVCGCLEATLVVPADWKSSFEPEMLRPILLHELEHIRQGDLVINWAAAVVNAIHWFNPLVWIAVSRFQCDRELRCDLNALSCMQPSERIGYGRALLRVQREFRPAPAIAGVAPCVRNHPSLHQRIQMIAKPTQGKRWLNAVIAPGIAGIIALAFGSATADEKKPEPPREGDKPREGGPREGGPREGGRPEGGRPEGGRPEGGRPEGGRPEGGRPEGGRPEGGRPEGGRPEGGRPEGGRPEGGRPEGGPRDGGMHERPFGVFVVRDGVRMGDRVVPMSQLRGEFSKVRAHSAVVSAEPDIPFQQVNDVVDALRDTGIRDIRFGGRPGPGRGGEEGGPRPEGGPREGGPRPEMRDGDRPRPEGGPRDGERPRPEMRDGDRPKPEGAPRDGQGRKPEGPRDGEGRKPEGARDGDHPKPEGAPRDGEGRKPEGGPRQEGPKPKPEEPQA